MKVSHFSHYCRFVENDETNLKDARSPVAVNPKSKQRSYSLLTLEEPTDCISFTVERINRNRSTRKVYTHTEYVLWQRQTMRNSCFESYCFVRWPFFTLTQFFRPPQYLRVWLRVRSRACILFIDRFANAWPSVLAIRRTSRFHVKECFTLSYLSISHNHEICVCFGESHRTCLALKETKLKS